MKRNKFSLSNYKLMSCDMGELVPVGLTEVLPGDTVQQATSALIRVSPLLAPVMHPVHVRIHHWFVPHRIVWDDFEDFITGGPDGTSTPTHPFVPFTNPTKGSLADYMGVPPGTYSVDANALPFRAYNMIYNEWYRDQDLQNELAISKASGSDTTTATSLKKVCWEKDYFTTARPWTQKGNEVSLPLGTEAPVKSSDVFKFKSKTSGGTGAGYYDSDTDHAGVNNRSGSWMDNDELQFDDPSNVFADLSGATAASVNQIREAFALQRYKEARARYGSRYTEYLRYLGIKSSDARLQRPEYLGGGKQTIQFSEVLQSSPTTSGTPNDGVGSLKGHGLSAVRSNRYRRFFEEHGYIVSVLSVKPKTMYAQGLQRTLFRGTKEDYFQRELQHIGQQEVKNKEVYALHSTPDGTFGYQDRYDEYRRSESSVAGDFRDSTLNYWHLGRTFGSDPALNGSFVECDPGKRVFIDQGSDDHLYVMAMHSIQARRMLAKMGSPGMTKL